MKSIPVITISRRLSSIHAWFSLWGQKLFVFKISLFYNRGAGVNLTGILLYFSLHSWKKKKIHLCHFNPILLARLLQPNVHFYTQDCKSLPSHVSCHSVYLTTLTFLHISRMFIDLSIRDSQKVGAGWFCHLVFLL